MRVLAGLLVLLIGAAATVAEAEAPKCQLQLLGDLPLRVDRGELVVDTEINGRPARMIVDTGAVATALFRPAAEALGLDVKPVIEVTRLQFYGVGGEADAAEARVSEFKLGTLIARNQDMLVLGRRAFGDTKGLLGAGFLMQADLEFDVADGRLRFFRPKGCAGDQVAYWGGAYSSARMTGSSADYKIRVVVRVNNVPVLAEMDTGSGRSMLTAAAAARAGVTPASEGAASAGKTIGIGPNEVPIHTGVFPSFSFGDETIKNASLEIGDLFGADKEVYTGTRLPAPAADTPAMLLGADFFRSHRVYIALSQRTVYVSYVGGPVFQTRAAAARPAAPPAN
jgi:clan AA aspartic protease (TIGR02281 family)